MAEFQEVMWNWIRARKENGYSNDVICKVKACEFTKEIIVKIENEVIQWAAEHPEPVYPSWKDWMFDSGIISNAALCEIRNMKYIYADLCKPIPADTAQKLGIEPKEE